MAKRQQSHPENTSISVTELAFKTLKAAIEFSELETTPGIQPDDIRIEDSYKAFANLHEQLKTLISLDTAFEINDGIYTYTLWLNQHGLQYTAHFSKLAK